MGCCFEVTTATLARSEPHPDRHVNYVLGMVLGEDDFRQEFAYLSGRDQWLARDAIGYGTLRGLAVRIEQDGAKGPRVYVEAGVALSPRGQLICVNAAQCAHINAWLAANETAVRARAGSPPGDVPLYVVLSYRECPADDVPIPGEPCRTEDQLIKPSRLRDDFCIELTLDPPQQREELAVRAFAAWLRQVDMSDATAPSMPMEGFLDALRDAARPWLVASPPGDPAPPAEFMSDPPPFGLTVRPEEAAEYLRAAFRLWVTELRPKWIQRWYGCAPNTDKALPAEDAVLLARIDVALLPAGGQGGFVASDQVLPPVDTAQRPFVVHLRMLQEWLLHAAAATAGIASPPGSGPGPAPGLVVTAETAFGLLPDSGSAVEYARADHTHGTPALTPLAGEVSGPMTSTTVAQLFGRDLTGPAGGPGEGQVLALRNNQWQPTTLDHVRRGAAQDYRIVAAGAVRFPIRPTGGTPVQGPAPAMLSAYNGLTPVGGYIPARGGFKFTFTGITPAGRYIVKITPWAPGGSGSNNPFMAYFSDFDTAAPFGFVVTVTVNPNAGVNTAGLMIEVSQIG